MSEAAEAVQDPPKAPEPTAEEIAAQKVKDDKGMAAFLNISKGRPVAVEKKEAPAETDEERIAREAKEAEAAKAKPEKKDGKEKKEDKAAPAKAAAPAKKVIRVAKGYEDIPSEATTKLTEAANRMTAAVEKVEKTVAAKPAATTVPETELTPQQKRELAILSNLKDVFPDKPNYKEIEKRAEGYIRELPKFDEKFDKDFMAKWERQNAEKQFDSEDARDTAFNDARTLAYEKEHEKFKAKYEIEPEPDDYDESLVSLRTKPLEEKLSKTQKQLDEISQKEREELVVQAAKSKGEAAAADINDQAAKVLADDVKDALKEDGSIDSEKLAALPDGDIIVEALTEAGDRAKNFASDVIMFLSSDQRDKNDPVYRFCEVQENRLAALPPEKTQDADGKVFAKGNAFAKMSKEEREKHWTLNADTIITLANDEVFLPQAKEAIDADRAKTAKRIERRGLKPAAAAPAKEAKTEKPTETPNSNGKPKSPASIDPTPPPPGGKPSGADIFYKITTGRF